MKNGWVKIFHGEYLTAADGEGISWSKTRMDGLRGVLLTWNGDVYEFVKGPGEYHYSEDYEVTVGHNDHKLLAKRVQFRTSEGWETLELDVTDGKVKYYMSENKI